MDLKLAANLDTTEIDRKLGDIALRGKRLAPAWRDLRRPLAADQREHARSESGPGGRWPARSAITEARRLSRNRSVKRNAAKEKAASLIALKSSGKRRRTTPKRMLGRLPTAFVVRVTDLAIRLTSRVKWSGVHQSGGRAGHGVRIPARPYYWLSRALLATTQRVIVEHLTKDWTK